MDITLLKKLRQEVNREIELSLSRCDITISLQMMGYQMGLFGSVSEQEQGKRFRPILCLLSSLAVSGSYKKALPAAAAIELIHNFSLIHDDIQDGDEYRRGKMTVWRKWGNNQAINAGDAMHTLSNLSLQKLFKMNLSSGVIGSVFSAVNNACYQMCEGQVLDVAYENKSRISIAQYLEMIRKKTAALIQSAPYCGALIVTKDRSVIRHYRNFGANAGMAFQIFNDLAGFENLDSKFAHFKSDLARNKKSLPIILALQGLEPKQKKSLKISKMLNLVRQSNAVQISRRIGEEYLEKALAELDKTGIKNPAQELLKEYVLNIKR